MCALGPHINKKHVQYGNSLNNTGLYMWLWGAKSNSEDVWRKQIYKKCLISHKKRGPLHGFSWARAAVSQLQANGVRWGEEEEDKEVDKVKRKGG